VQHVHIEAGYALFIDDHGEQKTSSVVEFDAQLSAVRTNVHVVDGVSTQLVDGFGDTAKVLHRGNCQ
jgi:hypothetical protein